MSTRTVKNPVRRLKLRTLARSCLLGSEGHKSPRFFRASLGARRARSSEDWLAKRFVDASFIQRQCVPTIPTSPIDRFYKGFRLLAGRPKNQGCDRLSVLTICVSARSPRQKVLPASSLRLPCTWCDAPGGSALVGRSGPR